MFSTPICQQTERMPLTISRICGFLLDVHSYGKCNPDRYDSSDAQEYHDLSATRNG